MFHAIPLNRAVAYLLLIGILPFLFVVFLFYSEKKTLEEFQERLDEIEHQIVLKDKKQALNRAVRTHFKDADHFYIDKYLETLVFLEPEIEQLQKIVQNPNFNGDERITKRLEYLSGSGNTLSFSEGVVQTFPFFQETSETLIHPVEVNVQDLQKILSRIEGTPVGGQTPGASRPQLIITDFKLDKKKMGEHSEVYLLNLKLIKREFL